MRLIVVVALEQLASLVVHEDVEDREEKARIRQAGETGVIRDEQALGLLLKAMFAGLAHGRGLWAGFAGFWAGPLYFVSSVPFSRRTEILLVPASAT